MREFFSGLYMFFTIVAVISIVIMFLSKLGDPNYSKTYNNYGFGDTLKTTFLLKDREILEERTKNLYQHFKIIESIPLMSGSFGFSSKVGTIYQLKLVRDFDKPEFVTTTKIK